MEPEPRTRQGPAPRVGRGGETQPTAPSVGAPLVAFDFDGTLTVEDSFVAFLRRRAGRWGWMRGCIALVPAGVAYLVHQDRGRLKSAAIRVFLRGVSRSTLAAEVEDFAADSFGGLMRPDALSTWARHRAEGAWMVIVTASPVEVVAPFAHRLGADDLIGSRLAWTGEDRVGDGLDGQNCRGPEKVRRLRQTYGPDVRLASAYGDTSGDREMLELADRAGLRVFSQRP